MPTEKVVQIRESLLIQRNHAVAIEYTRMAADDGLYIPFEMYSQDSIDLYCKTMPDLQKIRLDLDYDEEDITRTLMNDAEYNALVTKYQKLPLTRQRAARGRFEDDKERITQRIIDTQPEYVRLVNIHLKIKSVINRLSLKYIADAYLKRNQVFPIDWIPEDTQKILLRRRAVRKTNRDYVFVDEFLNRHLTNNRK